MGEDTGLAGNPNRQHPINGADAIGDDMKGDTMTGTSATQNAALSDQAPRRNGHRRSSLSDLPTGPFRKVIAERSGFDQCFQILVRYFRSKPLIFESPEDSAQEVLVRAAIISPENTQHCLAKLAKCQFINCLRKQHRRPINRLLRLDQVPTTVDPFASAEHEQLLAALHTAIDRLPEQAREMVKLHYFDGYSAAKIAAELKIHRHTVRNHLKQARQRLRAMLDIMPD